MFAGQDDPSAPTEKTGLLGHFVMLVYGLDRDRYIVYSMAYSLERPGAASRRKGGQAILVE